MDYCLVGEEDPWPEAVSDGLVSYCERCGVVPVIDYRVSDETWKKVVPKSLQTKVVCLECLIDIDPTVLGSVKEVYVCKGGLTLLLNPKTLYDYRGRKKC